MPTYGNSSNIQKYEYHVEKMSHDPKRQTDVLNQFAKEGWRLAAQSADLTWTFLTFERAINP